MIHFNHRLCYIIFAVFFCIAQLHSQPVANDDLETMAAQMLQQGNKGQAAEYYSKAGFYYWNKGMLKKAIDAFQNVFDLNQQLNNRQGEFVVLNNLGLLYTDIEDYNNALASFKRALEMSRIRNQKEEIASALVNVAITLQALNQHNETFNYFNEAVKLSQETNNLKLLRKCYGAMAESYEKTGKSDKAFQFYEQFSTLDKKIKATEMEQIQKSASDMVSVANEEKNKTLKVLDKTSSKLKVTEDSLIVTGRVAKERQMEIELKNSQLREKEHQIKYEKRVRSFLTYTISATVVFLIILSFFLLQKLRDNKLLRDQKNEIERQSSEISIQNDELDKQHKHITASINYAQTIQRAILPAKEVLDKCFESFIIYEPKDIVSGDFYWHSDLSGNSKKKKLVFAVIDCTGHGVPGAFMSMIGNRLLSEIVNEKRIVNPSEILITLNKDLRLALNQETSDNNDGMDVCLCHIEQLDAENYKIIFSGAKRPLYFHRKGSKLIEKLEADRISIGGRFSENEKIYFTNKEILLTSGDILFFSSDGVIDQNGTDRKRFGSPRFVETLKNLVNLPVNEQKQYFETVFYEYMKNEEQRDDITVIGVKLI